MHYVIVGGVAAGPKAASKIARLEPEAKITLVEQGSFLSYAGCGLPYYVSDVVGERDDLMATPVGVVRDAAFFKTVKNIEVLTHTQALSIDQARKRLEIQRENESTSRWLNYDKLLLATGASPVVPPLPGVELGHIYPLHKVEDADHIKALVTTNKVKQVVIIGGGLIGVEACEALKNCGAEVTVVEMLPQILNMLDWDMARLVEKHMEAQGVKVLTGVRAERFVGKNGVVEAVESSAGRLPADLVILAIGVRPNVELAKASGLRLGSSGAIAVDGQMRSSDPDIYAAGDCVECYHQVSETQVHVPLGSTANKQGRVAALNMCGREARFPGIVGSTICKVFDFAVGCSGLTEKTARKLGYDIEVAKAPAPDRAHYMPQAQPILLKLVASKIDGRLLGIQALGPGDASKRIDVAALAITQKMKVADLAQLDLSYAPPFSSAMDNLITGANVLQNKLDGLMQGIAAEELHKKMLRKDDFFLLDTRSPQEHAQGYLSGATLIPLGVLRQRLAEIPRDKEIVAYCKVSLRGYEAACILKHAGYDRVRVLDGGLVMWPYELRS